MEFKRPNTQPPTKHTLEKVDMTELMSEVDLTELMSQVHRLRDLVRRADVAKIIKQQLRVRF